MCCVLTCLFHSFFDEKVETQLYGVSEHGKWRCESTVNASLFALPGPRTPLLVVLATVVVPADEFLRLVAERRRCVCRPELLVEAEDRLRLVVGTGL